MPLRRYYAPWGSANNVPGGFPGGVPSGGPGSDSLANYSDDSTELSDPDLPDLRASNDTYKGSASGPGSDVVRDHKGASDTLALGPLESSEVHFEAGDLANDGTRNSELKSLI